MFRSIRWRIAVPYLVLILVTMPGLALYVSDQVRRARLSDLETQLVADARLMADGAVHVLTGKEQPETPQAAARRWGELMDARVTIIDVDGTVLGDSHADPAGMNNHLSRPEVKQAIETGQSSSVRFSETVGYEMMYAAAPVMEDGKTVGVVRVSVPLGEVEADVARLRNTLLAAAVVTALAAGLLAAFIAGRTTRQLSHLTEVAERIAEGDLNTRPYVETRDEVGVLTRAFNRMAAQLQERVTALSRERSRLAVVLENMADGIIIADASGRVQLINLTATRLLETTREDAIGVSFARVARDYRLIELWNLCLAQEKEQVETIEIDRRGLFLQAIVTPFQEGESRGYLLVLQDLTRTRRLETVRRDFISNISHELRTPLASLKALVETLRDGALEDAFAARRFLDLIDVELDAMTQMVQELLELSRIESGQVPLRLVPTPISSVTIPPIERLRQLAERAELEFVVVMPPILPPVLADAERVQQVVTNLVHNAIKFTPSGGTVTLSVEPREEEVIVSVGDTGFGIPADELPRIFERFYKADRARRSGGTGLGLAIARHIVQSHGGRIWAESTEGKGSTFYFSLPIAGEADNHSPPDAR